MKKISLPVIICFVLSCGGSNDHPNSEAGVDSADSNDMGITGTAGSNGALVKENDPTCQAAQISPQCFNSPDSTTCADHRPVCPNGTCIGTTCCFGCVNGDGKCVGGDTTLNCGGAGYDCHICAGSNFPNCDSGPPSPANIPRRYCSESTTCTSDCFDTAWNCFSSSSNCQPTN